MGRPALIAFVALVAAAGPAFAATCPTSNAYTELSASEITTLLSGTTACYPAGGPYTNQEYLAGTALWDYKLGPSNSTDPSANIGSVSITGPTPGEITYTYTGNPSSTFNYVIWGLPARGPGNYDFCSPSGNSLPAQVAIEAGTAHHC